METIYGDFVEQQESTEYLVISFSAATLSQKDRWRNNSLSADFLADYWGTFFPTHDASSRHRHTEVKDAVGYIANEMLENAIKFSSAGPQTPIRIGLYLTNQVLRFYISNAATAPQATRLEAYIKRLETEDPQEIYFQQIEKNAAGESDSSGLGILTIMLDYEAKIAWKFAPCPCPAEGCAAYITTMVEIQVIRDPA